MHKAKKGTWRTVCCQWKEKLFK